MPKYVALLNPRSGGRRATEYVLRKLQERLGEELVWVLFSHGDPAQDKAEVDLFLHAQMPELIIVAGGDGTISTIMDEVSKLHLQHRLPLNYGVIAPFPLGTGNDLSITLGFGSGFARWLVLGARRFQQQMRAYETSTVTQVDRWSLQLCTVTSPTAEKNERRYVFNNYFSVGFDAAVANRLNVFRGRHPYLFITRPVVKLWYFAFAVMALFTEKKIGATIQLRIDGRRVTVPASAKSVAVCNVLTYAGGAKAWNGQAQDRYSKPSICDGKVEVVCFYGIWHLVLVCLGCCYGRKLGQGSVVTIDTACHSCQFDGEAVTDAANETGTSSIRIASHSRAECLTCKPLPETHLFVVLFAAAAVLLPALCFHFRWLL